MQVPSLDTLDGRSPAVDGFSPHADAKASSGGEDCELAPSRDRSSLTHAARHRLETVEPRWQAVWQQARAFTAPAPGDAREPAYVFVSCPSTSEAVDVHHVRTFTIADAYARFLRARGRAVLFSVAFDSFDPVVQTEALGRGLSTDAWVKRSCEQTRMRLARLGCSCDWERSCNSSEPDHYRWTQVLFLKLLERDLVYRRAVPVNWCDSCASTTADAGVTDGRCARCGTSVRTAWLQRWLLRSSAFAQECERRLNASTVCEAAANRLRALVGRVEGVELDAATFDGDPITTFTDRPEAVSRAEFIAISPLHPQAGRWLAQPEQSDPAGDGHLAAWPVTSTTTGQVPLIDTGALATVPGVAGMLPIVISPAVDARYGQTAVLGMPTLDAIDANIARQLRRPSGVTWRATKAPASARPAVRYRLHDLPISCQGAWGTPIPIVHCRSCGAVPVPADDLPVRLPAALDATGKGDGSLTGTPGFADCACPSCGEPGRRETDTLDHRVDELWMWLGPCVPLEDRATAMLRHREHARWLPVALLVCDVEACRGLVDQGLAADLLADLGWLPSPGDRVPFATSFVHERFTTSRCRGDAAELHATIERVGADALRLSVLDAASSARPFDWSDQATQRSEKFLGELYEYASTRLHQWSGSDRQPARIDASDKLRRRLAHWCDVACVKITDGFERLQLQHAAHNAMLFFARVQDFEQRALGQHGELSERDRDAIVAALCLLVQMLAPLTPHIAEELWSLAGRRESVGQAPWPAPVRKSAAQARRDAAPQARRDAAQQIS
jgi:leucyl-tRNA synthetase